MSGVIFSGWGANKRMAGERRVLSSGVSCCLADAEIPRLRPEYGSAPHRSLGMTWSTAECRHRRGEGLAALRQVFRSSG
jgi:hypothetical protein